MISCNLIRTKQIKKKVKNYLEKNVLANKFLCKMHLQCKSSHDGIFYEGQLHHIGNFYDLTYKQKPYRIVIVGQEYGHKPARVTLEKRYKNIMNSATKKRFKALDNFGHRNPHMRGTTSVLKALFGFQLSTFYEDEFITIDGSKQHIFDSFALVDYLLCSAVPFEGSKKGKSTNEMKKNCRKHFRNVIKILEPNIIIVQGKQFFPWIKKSFDFSKNISENLYKSNIDFNEYLVASFTHPSAHFPYNWGANEKTQYLLNTVLPTVSKIRSIIGVA